MSQILAIETSCDETAAAVIEDGVVLSNIISSSIDLHSKYGGVVPEIAARAHIEAINPVISEALESANTDWGNISAIAVTNGPGLNGSLLVGVNAAKTLAYLKNKPLIPVHHIEGHIYSAFAENFQFSISNFQSNPNDKISNVEADSGQARMTERDSNSKKQIANSQPKFPILALVVSGGHSSLIYMRDHLKYEVVGKTIDDAVGEVFDKVAKLLDLGYPGGPIVSKLAEEGDKEAYIFPRVDITPAPERNAEGYLVQPEPNLNFSFSGLKTAVLNEIRNQKLITNNELLISNLCASFQQTVIDILVRNSVNAVNKYKPSSFVLCGGVSANKELRTQLGEKIKTDFKNVSYFVPDFSLSTDNAAMIGLVAEKKLNLKPNWPWQEVSTDPNLKLSA